MPMIQDRAVLTVKRDNGLWRVECDGEPFGRSRETEEAKATAHRHACKMSDEGRACAARVSGEDDRGSWNV